jgi:hypothetical protein
VVVLHRCLYRKRVYPAVTHDEHAPLTSSDAVHTFVYVPAERPKIASDFMAVR